MNCFLLPKNNIDFCIDSSSNVSNMNNTNTNQNSIATNTLHYYSKLENIIRKIITNSHNQPKYDYKQIINMANPYEYLYSSISEFNFSVSKLKTNTILLYDLLEINQVINFFDNIFDKNNNKKISILNIGLNCNEFKYFADMCNINHELLSFSIKEEFGCLNELSKFDFIFIENDSSSSSYNCINNDNNDNNDNNIIEIIFKSLKPNGNCLIKINSVFHNTLIQLLYLFSCLFEKVYIVKPTTSNVATFEKYIVCKYFTYANNDKINDPNTNINNLIKKEVPCYFCNKIKDLNSVLVQQQLEAMEQLINILKNKNREEKIELLKKNNIHKSIAWCEKYGISHQKFIEKSNIFLPITNEIINDLTNEKDEI
jgi:23S rRNA U2552 (ribose-2'-O)-methylase RlmE/FtsJ